ncbi:MAG: hypothetical protein HC893_12400 [Chloroflexaceae bacterium]|nr:hypothetical protein [Chloroflexaceae bacterium]
MITKATQRKPDNGEAKKPQMKSEMLSFHDGLATWPRAIAGALGERVWFNTSAQALRFSARAGSLMCTATGNHSQCRPIRSSWRLPRR